MLEKSENITNIAAALLKAQKEIGTALKNAENPYYKSHYADMKAVVEAIKEPLNNNGISFLQAVNGAGGENLPVVETMLLHESGQYLCSKAPVYCQKPNDGQAFGTGITYTKRYALQAFLGLPTEDDDGNAASGKNDKASKQKPKQKPADKSLKIVDDAFMQFQAAHITYLTDNKNVQLSKEKFIKAIQKEFKKMPTNAASIPKIVEKVKLADVIDDEFDAKIAEGADANTPS